MSFHKVKDWFRWLVWKWYFTLGVLGVVTMFFLHYGKWDFDGINVDGINVFVAYPVTVGVIVAIIQLTRNHHIQRTSFVRDYISRLFTDEKLYGTFHDLIYTYDDSLFKEVDDLVKEGKSFDHLQGNRKQGSRLYHPKKFQGSEEEKLLDSFLGYLDIIGYYLKRGMISVNDLGGYTRLLIRAVDSREVMRKYRSIYEQEWETVPTYRAKYGPSPFENIRHLCKEVKKHESEFEKREYEFEKRE